MSGAHAPGQERDGHQRRGGEQAFRLRFLSLVLFVLLLPLVVAVPLLLIRRLGPVPCATALIARSLREVRLVVLQLLFRQHVGFVGREHPTFALFSAVPLHTSRWLQGRAGSRGLQCLLSTIVVLSVIRGSTMVGVNRCVEPRGEPCRGDPCVEPDGDNGVSLLLASGVSRTSITD